MKGLSATLLALAAAILASSSSAFAPSTASSKMFIVNDRNTVTSRPFGQQQGAPYIAKQHPAALQRQRRSLAPVQTMSLFGLGGPEIAIILIAAAFVLGPQKIAELGKDAGKIAGELKEVPKEFQEGMKEGEAQVKSMKAKQMEVPPEIENDKSD